MGQKSQIDVAIDAPQCSTLPSSIYVSELTVRTDRLTIPCTVGRNLNLGDVVRICRLCGKEFTFTEGEQAFYLERGYRPPEYCPDCRDARRAVKAKRELESAPASRELFAATCSVCGKQTTVPFRPDPARPVLCDSCFAERRQGIVRN